MKVIKFQYDSKWYTLREDGKVKRDDQFFFHKGWVVDGFVVRDKSAKEVASLGVEELFASLHHSTAGSKDNPLSHLKGAMIRGSTMGREGFREGRPVEFIYAE